MNRSVSRKRQPEDLGPRPCPAHLSNSGAELRYLVGCLKRRITCHLCSSIARDHPATWVLAECCQSRRSPSGRMLKVSICFQMIVSLLTSLPCANPHARKRHLGTALLSVSRLFFVCLSFFSMLGTGGMRHLQVDVSTSSRRRLLLKCACNMVEYFGLMGTAGVETQRVKRTVDTFVEAEKPAGATLYRSRAAYLSHCCFEIAESVKRHNRSIPAPRAGHVAKNRRCSLLCAETDAVLVSQTVGSRNRSLRAHQTLRSRTDDETWQAFDTPHFHNANVCWAFVCSQTFTLFDTRSMRSHGHTEPHAQRRVQEISSYSRMHSRTDCTARKETCWTVWMNVQALNRGTKYALVVFFLQAIHVPREILRHIRGMQTQSHSC